MKKTFTRRSCCLVWLPALLAAIISLPLATAASNNSNRLATRQNAVEHTNEPANPPKPRHYTVAKNNYILPDITLIDQHGKKNRIIDLLNNQQPVLLQFIFTTCATICPVLSATFASAQTALEQTHTDYRMVSISIDPEQDTPRILEQYAKRFQAHRQWYFLTGNRGDIAKLQRAFSAYYPGNNKMYHQPYTFIRAKDSNTWIRIDGLMSTNDLVEEYLKLLALSESSESKSDDN